MPKSCDIVLAKPLKLIYDKCVETEQYPALWKRSSIVPAHKKNSHQIMKNYWPISLSVCEGNIQESHFNEVYEHHNQNKLLRSEKQSDIRPGNASINQLLSVTCFFTLSSFWCFYLFEDLFCHMGT